MKSKMRTVIIGCGLIAKSQAEAVRQCDQVELVGVCDVDGKKAEELGAHYGVGHYTDAGDLLDKCAPDFAIVCVPTFLHADMVELCGKAGVHVLCEKPLERSREACQRLIAYADQYGITVMTAQVVRFWPGYVQIKELYQSGQMGEVLMANFRRVSSRSGEYSSWLFDPDLGGGAMGDMLVHDIDYLRYLFGPFKSCYAHAVKDDTGCYNNVIANVVHTDGTHAIAEVSFNMQTDYPFSFSVSIIGTKMTVEYSFRAGITIADRAGASSSFKIWRKDQGLEEILVEDYDAYARQLKYFVDCLKTGRKPEIITLEESLQVITLIDTLVESAITQQPLPIQ